MTSPDDPTHARTEQGYAMVLLGRLLTAYDIEVTAWEDWYLNGKSLPAIRCLWFRSESGKSGQLDIQVMVREGVLVTESVAGIGEGETGLQDAFYNMTTSSLPVLLAAFWGRIDTDDLTVDALEVGDRRFTAYVGNFGIRSSADEKSLVPASALSSLLDTVSKTTNPSDIIWTSTFFCNASGQEKIFSAQLNNDPWADGEDCLKAIPWAFRDEYYSVRHFMVLRELIA